jgi:hypothetical protein
MANDFAFPRPLSGGIFAPNGKRVNKHRCNFNEFAPRDAISEKHFLKSPNIVTFQINYLMATNNEIDNSGTSIEMRQLKILISFFRFATEEILIGISSCQNGRSVLLKLNLRRIWLFRLRFLAKSSGTIQEKNLSCGRAN